jgi:hypothetical protein
MTALLAIASCVLGTVLRIALGVSSPAVPWCALAWTILFARRSRRASFAAFAVVLGGIEGLAAPVPWTVWPIACLAAGIAAHATRRVLPVRSAAGEGALAALLLLVVRLLLQPLAPFGLPAATASFASCAIEAVATGAMTMALAILSRRWDALRMSLARVT